MPVRWRKTARSAATAKAVPKNKVKVTHSPITFRETALAYLESRRLSKGGLNKRTEYQVQAFVDVWGEHLLAELDDEAIVGWVDDYQRTHGVGPATRNKMLTGMRAILRWANERGWLAHEPRFRVGAPTFRDRHLELDEIPLFLDWIAEHKPHLHLGMLIFVDAGVRAGEAKRLVWRDVVWQWPKGTRGHLSGLGVEPVGGSLRVRKPEGGGTSKTRMREIPLSRRLLSQLIVERAARKPKASDLLIVVRGGYRGLTPKAYADLAQPYDPFREAVAEFCAAFGIEPKLTLHDLRHTFAYQCGAAGVDLADLQTLMGHASINMTMRYRGYCRSRATEVIASF